MEVQESGDKAWGTAFLSKSCQPRKVVLPLALVDDFSGARLSASTIPAEDHLDVEVQLSCRSS